MVESHNDEKIEKMLGPQYLGKQPKSYDPYRGKKAIRGERKNPHIRYNEKKEREALKKEKAKEKEFLE